MVVVVLAVVVLVVVVLYMVVMVVVAVIVIVIVLVWWYYMVVMVIDWLLDVYVLLTSKVISRQLPTCNSMQVRRLYNAAPLGNQDVSTMT